MRSGSILSADASNELLYALDSSRIKTSPMLPGGTDIRYGAFRS